MDQLERLERLNRLRESGALSEAEFEAQKAAILSDSKKSTGKHAWVWITASALLATMIVILFIRTIRDQQVPAPVIAAPQTNVVAANVVAPAPPPAPPPCVAPTCRVLTAQGWAEVRVGMRVEAAMAAAHLRLRRPGHYDDAFADEPERLRQCNIYQMVGAPENITVFVENGIITSLGAGIRGEDGGVTFQTDRGVRLGDPESAVRRAYPRLRQEPNIYSEPPDKMLFYRAPDGHGIKFSIGHGVVEGIDVGGGSISYVEGCL